jgi:hypothetical protein
VTSSLFEGETLERLRLACEEIAYLLGRGYPEGEVRALVANYRRISSEEQALLDRAVCSEPQYRGRATREMLPEDIARRPLVVDGHDVIDAITTALAGGALIEGLDQTVQPLSPGGALEHVDAALARIGPVLREMRPSKTKWLLDAARPDTPVLADKLNAAAKKWKVPVEVVTLSSPKATLKSAANVVTNDPAILDSCKSWCNLAGPVVFAIEGAKRIKLQ